MLEFELKKLKLKFDGKVYEVNYPNVGDIREYNEKLKAKEGDDLDLVVGLLEKLGLPRSASEKMLVEQLNTLVQELIKTKK